ncbi:MFS transporter [Streptomyces exfoliatus]|uniref:MFS transporter n=1 Tax=Streptomyces exfoliatus TaxID=1905 RepID=UPI0004666548|nr:MFS transporter [Streptomyces exfoliatus]
MVILGYVRLLRSRSVLTLWVGQALSVFGDRLYAMAVMWIAFEESGAFAMGLVAIAESVPYIVLGTVGRRIVGRFDSLGALAAVDVVRAGLVAALPLAWSHFGLAGALALVLVAGFAGAVFDPNLGALTPELVEKKDVQAVSGLMDLSGRIARIAGPGAAGLLLAVMPMTTLFWLDGATFLVSAAALAVLARRSPVVRQDRGPEKETAQPQARVLLRARPDTGVAIGVHGIGIAAHTVALALPAFITLQLGGGAGTYGAVLAATGAGALAANGLAGNLRLPPNLPAFYCLAWAVSGAVLASIALAGSVPALLALSVLLGAVNPFVQVALVTHLSSFPPAQRLRLMSVDLTVIRTAGTASMLFVPALAANRPSLAFVVAGLGLVGVGLIGAVLAARWARDVPVPGQEPVGTGTSERARGR